MKRLIEALAAIRDVLLILVLAAMLYVGASIVGAVGDAAGEFRRVPARTTTGR